MAILEVAERDVDELARLAPEVAQAAGAAVAQATTDLGFVRLDAEAFARAPQISIDYALMERTHRAAIVEGRFLARELEPTAQVRSPRP